MNRENYFCATFYAGQLPCPYLFKTTKMNIAVITGPNEISASVTACFAGAGCIFCEAPGSVPQNADAVIDLDFSFSAERINALRSLLPRTILVNSVLHTLDEIKEPFIRFNGWPGFINTRAMEVAGNDTPQAKQLFTELKWNIIVSPDTCGFTVPRVVCMIINEAYFAFGEGVSSKEEIDVAMKLGTNYPYGPFEWCSITGISRVYQLLQKLSVNDSRYTPAPALEKEAVNNKL